MNKDVILGLVRHILTTAGGFLASKGLISESEIEIGAGALVVIIGVIWSAWIKQAKKEEVT